MLVRLQTDNNNKSRDTDSLSVKTIQKIVYKCENAIWKPTLPFMLSK